MSGSVISREGGPNSRPGGQALKLHMSEPNVAMRFSDIQ
jgi:hypothetical protein